MYRKGEGVEKDREKEVYVIVCMLDRMDRNMSCYCGLPWATNNLGCNAGSNGDIERAVKHWISATQVWAEFGAVITLAAVK